MRLVPGLLPSPKTPRFYMVKLGVIRDIYIIVCAFSLNHMSRVVRKPAFCIRENKDADQLRGNREADQRLCFRYIYMASKVKHHPNIFIEKTVKLSKHEFFLVTFLREIKW